MYVFAPLQKASTLVVRSDWASVTAFCLDDTLACAASTLPALVPLLEQAARATPTMPQMQQRSCRRPVPNQSRRREPTCAVFTGQESASAVGPASSAENEPTGRP